MRDWKVLIFLLLCITSIIFIDASLAYARNEPAFQLIYTIQEGDNITTIAKKFHITRSLLKKQTI